MIDTHPPEVARDALEIYQQYDPAERGKTQAITVAAALYIAYCRDGRDSRPTQDSLSMEFECSRQSIRNRIREIDEALGLSEDQRSGIDL